MFRPNGNIQLSGAVDFWNRLTFFPGKRGGGAGEVSCRYRTQGPGGRDHALSFVVHETATATERRRVEIVVRSDQRAQIRYSEIQPGGRPLKQTLLAEASIPPTNGDWRDYALKVDSRSLRLTIDGKAVFARELPEELSSQVALDGVWGLELSRSGSSIYPSDAFLRRLEIVRSSGGARPPLAALSFRRRPRLEDETLRYLNFKYSNSRGYLRRRHGYLVKQIDLPILEERTEYVPALFAPSGSSYRFKLDVAPGDRLKTRYGLYQDPSSPMSASASFDVRMTRGGGSELLFSETLHASEATRLLELDVPLPVDRPGHIELTLEVRAPEPSEGVRSDPRAALGLWASPLVMRPRAWNEPRRPNVIVISLDTLRRDHVGLYDGGLPSLSRFAEGATTFAKAYSVSPWTMPSHFSLLSGRYPSNHGLNRAFGTNTTAFEEVETFAQVLAGAGYVTAAIASDHSLDPVHGFDNGFHSFLDNEVRDVAPLIPSLERFLDTHDREEFFLFLHSYDPHAPLAAQGGEAGTDRVGDVIIYNDFLELEEPTDEERELVERLYAKRVRDYDGFFGQILDLLEKHGVLETSVVVFTSDHGEELFERGAYQHGHSLYEELLQVPLIVKFPDADGMPSQATNLTALIDVVPTLLEYLGIEAPAGIDGQSFLDVLKGREPAHRRYLLAEALAWGPERKAVVTDRYKYIVTYSGDDLPQMEPRADFYDTLFDSTPGTELYDLKNDPVERVNVAPQQAELAGRLEQLLKPLLEAKPGARGGVEKDSDRIELLRSLGYVR